MPSCFQENNSLLYFVDWLMFKPIMVIINTLQSKICNTIKKKISNIT